MYYVYVLTNLDKSRHYIGYTEDLKRRLSEHKRGHSYWSSRLTGAMLYYYEAYTTEEVAKNRERKLKQYGSSYKGLLKRIGLIK